MSVQRLDLVNGQQIFGCHDHKSGRAKESLTCGVIAKSENVSFTGMLENTDTLQPWMKR